MHRVLRPGAPLLLAFHAGDDVVPVDELFGVPASVEFRLHPVARVEGALRDAGLVEVETILREPYPEVEHPTRRAYVFARTPRGRHPSW